jgi:hypothetical protein
VGRRCIGLDVRREFAQVAVWEDGLVRQAGQIALPDEALRVLPTAGAPRMRWQSRRCATRTRSCVASNPRVKQSGGQPASLRAFYERVRGCPIFCVALVG